MSAPNRRDQVSERLRGVVDPELRRSIVELGMVRSIEIGEERPGRGRRLPDDGRLPDPLHFEQAVAPSGRRAGRGVRQVAVGFDVLFGGGEEGGLPEALGRGRLPEGALGARSENVVCVASGEGGVEPESTMTANLAAALTAEDGAQPGHSTATSTPL